MDELIQDVRYGARKLIQAPGFTAAVVAVLALGIGANTAIYSAVDAAFLRPLPFHEPERLVALENAQLPLNLGRQRFAQSVPELKDFENERDVFATTAAYATGGLNLVGGAEPARVVVTYVTASFFDVLGRMPALGRPFNAGEMSSGGPPAIILSDALWQHQFGDDARVVGRKVTLSNNSYSVVGVMPPDFRFPAQTEVWIALPLPVEWAVFEAFRNFLPSRFIARLAPGVTVQQAALRTDVLRRRFRPKIDPDDDPVSKLAQPLQQTLVGDRRQALLILMGSAALLLLIACANVTNLLLSRGAAREREIAVRVVLGATRGRVIRQLVVESLIVAIVGGVAALGVAYLSLGALSAALPSALAGVAPPRIDMRVLAFTLVLAAGTSFLFGLWPAIGASRPDLGDAMKAGGWGSTRRAGRHVRALLVVSEVSLALMLLVGAGLMLRSLRTLLQTNTGFRTENVITARMTIPGAKYKGPALRQFIASIVSRLGTAPGVDAAGAVSLLPMAGEGGISLRVSPEGGESDENRTTFASYLMATPGYFKAMGVALSGQDLPGVADTTRPVAVINQAMAAKLWPGQDPLGKRFVMGKFPRTVIGVVADMRNTSLDAAATPQMFWPMAEAAQNYVSIVVRGTDQRMLLDRVRQSVAAFDPMQPVYGTRSMEEVVAGSVAPRRTNTLLLTVFGAVALVLAAVGVYAVLAYSVSQRTREIGVRVALGARRADVLRLVLRQGTVLAVAGIVIGTAGAYSLSRFLTSIVYEVSVHDPWVFIAAPAVLLVIALVATWIPAWRATRVDPMIALRAD